MNTGTPVMGIRIGKEPVIYKDAVEAAGYTGLSAHTVSAMIRTGRQSKAGWSFDFCIEWLAY